MSDGLRADAAGEVGGRYAKYVLFVLVIVYVFNFIDRQILSILAEDIKADLGVTDAQLGFRAAHGCDDVQGNFFCPPLAARETARIFHCSRPAASR